MFNTKTYEKVLCGTKKATGNLHFDDIINGVVQLRGEDNQNWGIQKGNTFVKSVELCGGLGEWEEDTAGKVNSTLHILSIEECKLNDW